MDTDYIITPVIVEKKFGRLSIDLVPFINP